MSGQQIDRLKSNQIVCGIFNPGNMTLKFEITRKGCFLPDGSVGLTGISCNSVGYDVMSE